MRVVVLLLNLLGKVAPGTKKRVERRLRRMRHPAWLGNLRCTTPLSQKWGYDRGTPIDRHYIEHFLCAHRQDIRGRVLEVKDSGYTNRYGTDVERCEVVDIDASNSRATIVTDLAAADGIRANQFDCVVLTQTLQYIHEPRAALQHIHRILRSGGVLLATVPAISRLDEQLTDYWRFTPLACTMLFGAVFGTEQVTVQPHGSVLSAVAFLVGMAAEELSPRELASHDARFPIVITVRAVKQHEG